MVRRCAALLAVLLVLAGCSEDRESVSQIEPTALPEEVQPATPVAAADTRDPNIVLVLMDDFSMDLLPTMPNAARMQEKGASYPHAFVVDSLCCVSRASIATGQYPHQTGVFTNTANTPNDVGPIGGWEAFVEHGNNERAVNVRLQQAGYTTGFIGKYLNQYEWVPGGEIPPPPPGWDDWRVVFGSAYDGWDFESTYVEDGLVHLKSHLAPPAEASAAEKDKQYVGSVIERGALEFIRDRRDDESPYFLQVSPYATHSRTNPTGAYAGDPIFPPAFRDRPRPGRPMGNCGVVRCGELTIDDLPGFGDDQQDNAPRLEDGTEAASWKGVPPAMTKGQAIKTLRDRARMAQSVDRMLGKILANVSEDTYVVLTSDNGFHVGQHGLGRGKGAPYATDAQVPLIVTGPGVEQGERDVVVSSIDFASTFEELAGLRPERFRGGRSIAATLRGDRQLQAPQGPEGRDYVFFEHTWAPSLGDDPDRPYAGGTIDLIPSYVAVRSRDALLVRVDLDPDWEETSYAWEFYDYSETGWERTNTYGQPRHRDTIRELTRRLEGFDACAAATRDDRVSPACRALSAAEGQ
ncbi:hypothetical protein GCM10027026_15240 [Myroides odoratimimus subsp. xuanwuensis]